MKKHFILIFTVSLLLICYDLQAQENCIHNSDTVDELLKELRRAESDFKTNRLIKKITSLEIPYDSLVNKIKTINYYKTTAETGYNEWNYTIDSLNYTCIVIVPTSYSVNKQYPVSFVLHGAVNNLNPVAVQDYAPKEKNIADSLSHIMVYPAGWVQSPWWSSEQVKNLKYLLNRLKITYNVDENNISLAGISDGGTGTVYQANKNITPWSNFRCYIGNPLGISFLSNSPVYLNNLSNRHFLFVSTENDPIFPPQRIESFLNQLNSVSLKYTYLLVKKYQHNLSWFPAYKDTISSFINTHTRNPYPKKIFWQADQDEYGRNHWVIIEKLSKGISYRATDFKMIKPEISDKNKSGAIDVTCKGNKIYVKTINVKKYKLLLSPEMFDFSKKIEVHTNGELSFTGKIVKNSDVLLYWFNQDKDRSMLFGYELKIKV